MKRLGKALITLLIMFAFVPVGKVFAGGGYANEGTSPTGGGCSYNSYDLWWDTCFGYSWQKYEVLKDLPSVKAAGSKQVYFHYTPQTGGPVYLNYCKKGQTLYHYGFEAHYGNNSAGYQVSTQSDKGGVQARWRNIGTAKKPKYQALGAYPGANSRNVSTYLRASGYATYNAAYKNFSKMANDSRSGEWLPKNVNWWNVGYFCYTPGYTLTVHYIDIDTKKEIIGATNYKERPENKYTAVSFKGIDNYRFLGWSTKVNGKISTTTKASSHKPYVSDAYGSNKISSGKYPVYKKAHVYMNNSYDVYAMYTRIYYLAKNTDAGVKSLVVNRTSSPYSTNNNNLGNNSQIYKNDSLSICLTLRANYRLKDFYIESPYGTRKVTLTKNNGYYCGSAAKRYVVTHNTKIVVKTEPIIPPTTGGTCEATGDSFTGDDTQVVSKVKNLGANTGWSKWAYAAPSQPIEWVHCYYSGVQKTSGDNSFRVVQNHIFPSVPSLDGLPTKSFVAGVYTSDKFSLSNNKPVVKELRDKYTVETGKSSRVGLALSETISSSYGGTEVSSFAGISVPYNFDIISERVIVEEVVNEDATDEEVDLGGTGDDESDEEIIVGEAEEGEEETEEEPEIITREIRSKPVIVKMDDSRDVVFAGEKTGVKEVLVYVGKRYNQLSDDTYATRVDNAHIELHSCVANDRNGSGCSLQYTGINWRGRFNEDEDKEGSLDHITEFNNGNKLSVPDVSAGKYFCVMATYGPSTVNGDADMESKTGEGVTDLVCKPIAKKPSIQIWGGNIYSLNNINTLTAEKTSLAGYAYDGKVHTFGSWGELGIIAAGTVRGLASGAGTGYSSNNGGTLIANPGGGIDNNFCKRSTLSFANNECTSYTGRLGGSFPAGEGRDRSNISNNFSNFIDVNDILEVDDGSIVNITNDSHKNITSDQDMTIGSANISEGTYMVHSDDNNITITGDLKYGGIYESLNTVPKLIVYAQNIYIGCNVRIIDAILVAEDKVITCGDNVGGGDDSAILDSVKSSINNKSNSKQLIINGAVIANRVIANRTFGAATGGISIMPAEIINFDPTLYLWGVRTTGESSVSGGKLIVTNTKELPPRF